MYTIHYRLQTTDYRLHTTYYTLKPKPYTRRHAAEKQALETELSVAYNSLGVSLKKSGDVNPKP